MEPWVRWLRIMGRRVHRQVRQILRPLRVCAMIWTWTLERVSNTSFQHRMFYKKEHLSHHALFILLDKISKPAISFQPAYGPSCASVNTYRRHMCHPTGHPAMLVAIAAAFYRSALEYGKHKLQPGVKPRVRMQQLAFIVYKVRTLTDII